MTSAPDELDVVDYIQVTADTYTQLGYGTYRWADSRDSAPALVAAKPLSESRVVLIASGGVYRHGDVGFSHKDDTTFREIPMETPTDELRVTHFAYDQTNAREDVNAVFPIDALRTMRDQGAVGSLAETALAFMGGIYSQRRLGETLIPALVERAQSLAADVALLVPV